VSLAGREWRAAAPRGLSLTALYTPYLTSLSARKRGNGAFALRVAYDILPWLGAGVAVGTGSEYVDSTRLGPTAGKLSLGTLTLEVVLHPIESRTLRPFLAIGYGPCTILDGRSGYNGDGIGVDLGEEIRIGTDIGLAAALSYQHRTYPQRIDDGRSTEPGSPIGEHTLGIGIGGTLYFELSPSSRP
jgi:hypothetical protein